MIFVLMPRSISLFEAVLSSYAARTARARPISSKLCRCSRPGAAYAERNLRNARASAAPAASRCRSKSRRTARRISWAPAGSRARTARRRSGATASTARRVASSRAFCDHVRLVWLTPAMDSLFAGPASERRRFLDRFVLAIDPNHGARVGQFERALARTQPAPGRGRAQRRMARRDRARSGSARRRGRRGAARMRAPARSADRRRARRFIALSLGEARASKARSRP